MCLYGQDIGEDMTPLEARLEWVVKFDKEDFIGREALLKQRESGISKIRVCFTMKNGGIPRSSYTILKSEKEIGHVTSGTFSPLLRKGIGMGYVQSEEDVVGGEVEILVRGRQMAAVLVEPFETTMGIPTSICVMPSPTVKVVVEVEPDTALIWHSAPEPSP